LFTGRADAFLLQKTEYVVVRLFEEKKTGKFSFGRPCYKHSDRDNNELESWLYRLLSSSGFGWWVVPARV